MYKCKKKKKKTPKNIICKERNKVPALLLRCFPTPVPTPSMQLSHDPLGTPSLTLTLTTRAHTHGSEGKLVISWRGQTGIGWACTLRVLSRHRQRAALTGQTFCRGSPACWGTSVPCSQHPPSANPRSAELRGPRTHCPAASCWTSLLRWQSRTQNVTVCEGPAQRSGRSPLLSGPG